MRIKPPSTSLGLLCCDTNLRSLSALSLPPGQLGCPESRVLSQVLTVSTSFHSCVYLFGQ